MNKHIKEIKIKRPLENIEEPVLDLKMLKKKTNAKTPSGLMLKYARQLKDKKDFLMAQLFLELHSQIRQMEKTETYRAKQWRGRSGVTYQIKPDYVIALRFRKKDIGDKPSEVRTEMSKEQINRVRYAINVLNTKEIIETREIAEKVYNITWSKVFANRPHHTILVEVLNYLEYVGEIKYYRSGKIKVLNQEKLK